MPTTRTRRSRNRVEGAGGLTAAQLEDLLRGYAFFEEPFKDDEARRRCWEKHRGYIMSLQGKPVQSEAFGLENGVYFDFGTRPNAWWDYDSPGPRLFVSCTNDFCQFFLECPVAKNIPTEMPDCVIREGEDRKGKSSFCGLLKIECVSKNFRIFEPALESETDFLRRYDLLTEEEKERSGKNNLILSTERMVKNDSMSKNETGTGP
jgi:hypothetical protein